MGDWIVCRLTFTLRVGGRVVELAYGAHGGELNRNIMPHAEGIATEVADKLNETLLVTLRHLLRNGLPR